MAAHVPMIRAYVEKLLELGYGQEIAPEPDGMYVLPGDGLVVVEVDNGQGSAPRVAVRGLLVVGVKRSLKLLQALNNVNGDLPYGRVWWQDDRIIGEVAIVAEGVNQEHLANAVGVVGWLTNSVGPDLAKSFGGHSTAQAPADGAGAGPGGATSGGGSTATSGGFGPEPAALNRGAGAPSGGEPAPARHLPPAACPPGYL